MLSMRQLEWFFKVRQLEIKYHVEYEYYLIPKLSH